jgi:hypothetical protein
VLSVAAIQQQQATQGAVPTAPHRVIVEDIQLQRDTAKLVAATFGTQELPCIPRVDLDVHTDYTPPTSSIASGGGSTYPFVIKVRFEGSSVLQGLRCLAPAGLTTKQLPEVLSNLHSAQSTSLVMQADGSIHAKAQLDLGIVSGAPQPRASD